MQNSNDPDKTQKEIGNYEKYCCASVAGFLRRRCHFRNVTYVMQYALVVPVRLELPDDFGKARASSPVLVTDAQPYRHTVTVQTLAGVKGQKKIGQNHGK